MSKIEKILKEEQSKVAKENHLGNNLVTGHRKYYFDQAAKNTIIRILENILIDNDNISCTPEGISNENFNNHIKKYLNEK